MDHRVEAMFASHSYASKAQLLNWVSELLKMNVENLNDVRADLCLHR